MKPSHAGSPESLKRVEAMNSVLRIIGVKEEPTESEYCSAHQAPRAKSEILPEASSFCFDRLSAEILHYVSVKRI